VGIVGDLAANCAECGEVARLVHCKGLNAAPTTRTENEMTIKYRVYSPILKKTFDHVGTFSDMVSFRTHAYALYSGNWTIIND
jgi:hypothetical protein